MHPDRVTNLDLAAYLGEANGKLDLLILQTSGLETRVRLLELAWAKVAGLSAAASFVGSVIVSWFH